MNLLNEASDSIFVTRKWNIINDQSNTNFDVGNEIIYNINVLKSNFCDYNDTYVLIKGDIAVVAARDAQVTQVLKQNLKIVRHLRGAPQKLMEQQ